MRRRRHHRRHEAGITDARARQIQAALVKAGYLRHVSGHWNWATHEAMVRYQRAHGWQTRWVPDSRALIALGVGPRRDEPPARHAQPAAVKPAPARSHASEKTQGTPRPGKG